MSTACEKIAEKVGELFICSPVNQYTRIRTPFLYPDGDVIDLFLKEEGDYNILTDMGETIRWLGMQTTKKGRTPKQNQLVTDICLNQDVQFNYGTLSIKLKPYDDLAVAVMRLAQAALNVSDLWFTFRYRATETVVDEVEDFLKEREILFERDFPLRGRSGRNWKLDFHTIISQRDSLIFVLSTGNHTTADKLTETAFTTWADLSHLRSSYEFISLFDDTLDIWTPENFRLVENVSNIVHWSRPNELIEKLVA